MRAYYAAARTDREAAVSLIFAIASIPILMLAGLAIDYGFYNEAKAQLNMAADAASIHAVKVASEAYQSKQSDYILQGNTAGSQWFVAQLGLIGRGIAAVPVVVTQYDAGSRTFKADVSYSSRMNTFFGGVFNLSRLATWQIGITSEAVITVPGYVEVQMLLDNSSSMLIASGAPDIAAMEQNTPCSTQAANEPGQQMNSAITYSNGSYSGTRVYTYDYPLSTTPAKNSVPANIFVPYGYNQFTYPTANNTTNTINQLSPPSQPPAGSMCDPRFTGDVASQCFYPPGNVAAITQPSGTCMVNGVPLGGSTGYLNSSNTPQAPCAFACHNMPGKGKTAPDYYGLARTLGVDLRFDDVNNAADLVIRKMQQFQPNLLSQPQLSIGVSVFNAENTNSQGVTSPAFTNKYPGNGSEAGTDLTAALTQVDDLEPLQVNDSADTDIPSAMIGMTALLTKAGDGGTPATPQKNLFFVTDGLQDYNAVFGNDTTRTQGAIDPSICDPIKKLNVKIFVLYTNYLPLPNEYYLDNDKAAVEGNGAGTPPVAAALLACSSGPAYYFEAKSASDIRAAMQNMLAVALNVPGRLSQ